jgi:hypothetical protein
VGGLEGEDLEVLFHGGGDVPGGAARGAGFARGAVREAELAEPEGAGGPMGGHLGGEPRLTVGCTTIDESSCYGFCGDGVTNGSEACDGTNLGGDSCQTRGYYTGFLACDVDCSTIDGGGCSGLCGDGVCDSAFGDRTSTAGSLEVETAVSVLEVECVDW